MNSKEEKFIRDLKRKDERALDYLIDNYGWIIKTVVKKHLESIPTVVEECINDILMDIWNNINRFDSSKGDIKNWIAGISKFKAIDYKRKYMRDLYNESIDDVVLSVEDKEQESILNKELSVETEAFLNCLKKRR